MKRLTAIICPGETKRWMVALNLETGATSQGPTLEQALANLKEATELYLEEKGGQRHRDEHPGLSSSWR